MHGRQRNVQRVFGPRERDSSLLHQALAQSLGGVVNLQNRLPSSDLPSSVSVFRVRL